MLVNMLSSAHEQCCLTSCHNDKKQQKKPRHISRVRQILSTAANVELKPDPASSSFVSLFPTDGVFRACKVAAPTSFLL